MTRKASIAALQTVALTDSASRNILINNVKQMFEKGTIKYLSAAEKLINLLQDDKMDEFDAQFNKLDKAVSAKAEKRKAAETVRDANYDVQQRETSKHIVKSKNKNSELPTFKLKFKKVHTKFEAAWKDGVVRLIKIASDTIKEKQNLKIVV